MKHEDILEIEDVAYTRARNLLAVLNETLGEDPFEKGSSQGTTETFQAGFPADHELSKHSGKVHDPPNKSLEEITRKVQEPLPTFEGHKLIDLEFAQLSSQTLKPLVLLRAYSTLCSKFIANDSSEYYLNTNNADISRNNLIREVKLRQNEKDIWDLLFHVHHPRQYPVEGDEEYESQSVTHGKTGQEKLNIAFRADKELQLYHRVTLWLQHIAQTTLEGERMLGTLSEMNSVGYMKKSVDLMLGKRFDYELEHHGICEKIDPDTRIRDFQRLHPDDEDLQSAFLAKLWFLIRTGAFYETFHDNISEDNQDGYNSSYNRSTKIAIDLCRKFAEPWRAASLLGGLADECSLNDSLFYRRGNVYRAVWKYACRKLANEDGQKNLLERAIYAIMSQDVEFLLRSSCCSAWLDKLWVYFRCIIQAKVDNIISEHRQKNLLSTPNVAGPKNEIFESSLDSSGAILREMKPSAIFASINTLGHKKFLEEAQSWHHTVQAAIIQGNLNQLLYQDFCPFYFGNSWHLTPILVLSYICGVKFVRDQSSLISATLGINYSMNGDEELNIFSFPCWKKIDEVDIIPEIWRILSHIVLYFSKLENDHVVVRETSPIELSVLYSILITYICYLLMKEEYQCVLLYFKDLPNILCHALFSAVLEGLLSTQDAKRCEFFKSLAAGVDETSRQAMVVQAFLNVFNQWKEDRSQCVLLKSSTVKLKENVSFEGFEAINLPKNHSRLLQCWRYFLLLPSLQVEGLVQANAVFRESFINHAKMVLAAEENNELFVQWNFAMELMRLLSSSQAGDAISQVEQTRFSDLNIENILNELECWRLFIQAKSAVFRWSKLILTAENELREAELNLENALSKNEKHLTRVKEVKEFIQLTLNELSNEADSIVHQFKNILARRDGWMLDLNNRVTNFSSSFCEAELKSQNVLRSELIGTIDEPGIIRRLGVPQISFLYQHVLFKTARLLEAYAFHSSVPRIHYMKSATFYKESTKLADFVAANDLCLFKCFTKTQLDIFLKHIQESAMHILKYTE